MASLKLLASARSAGKKLTFRGEKLPVEELTEKSFKGVELVLASAGGSDRQEVRPRSPRRPARWWWTTPRPSAWTDGVPLVVPEVNPRGHQDRTRASSPTRTARRSS